ncbi:uncharacterized protein LOC132698521 [Cylas formicarius]|uniref:uncharacterized protein LOC132698521 n=1 Tax=Cylas formicarius TaxID=197179 RepID=UPI002958D804|nr:uncharacterized protein LOC132698521 [Cylas formicarius]
MIIAAAIVLAAVFQKGFSTDDVTKDEVKELYANFLTTLNQTANETLADIEQNVLEFEDNVFQALYYAKYYLMTEKDVYNFDDFERIMRKAQEQGTNFSHCSPLITEFLNLDTLLWPNLTSCINSTSDEAEALIKIYKANYSSTIENLPVLDDDIDKCSDQECLQSLLDQITELGESIPAQILELRSNIEAVNIQYSNEINTCVANARIDLSVRARIIMSEYAICTGVETFKNLYTKIHLNNRD